MEQEPSSYRQGALEDMAQHLVDAIAEEAKASGESVDLLKLQDDLLDKMIEMRNIGKHDDEIIDAMAAIQYPKSIPQQNELLRKYVKKLERHKNSVEALDLRNS